MPVFTIETPAGQKLDIEANDEATAISGAQKWHADNSSAVGPDVLKSAGIGPVKAAIGMAGALPDASAGLHNLANNYLFDPLFNAISGPPKEGPKPPDINQLAGSENIRKGVENITGPLYEPKTTQGKYAQAITEATTGAMVGPGGLGMKVAQGLGTGAGSEAAGDYFTGALKPYAQFAGGLAGGLASSAGLKGIQGVKNFTSASDTGAQIANEIGGPQLKTGAVNRVAQNIADDDLTKSGIAAKSQALGPDAMLLDMGHQLEGRADFMAQTPGKAQNTVYKPIADRVDSGNGAAGRLNDVLDTHLGPSRDVVDLQNKIADLSNKYVAPAYKDLENKFPVINDNRLGELAQRPAIEEAMKRAEGVAANYGEQVNGTQPSIRYWDYVKKSLDQRINGMMRSGQDDLSSAQKADLGGLISAKQALVEHLDNATGGEYARARKLATTKPAMEDALEFGRSMFGNKLLPEQISSHIGGLSLAEQEMVKIGARREIERQAASSGNEGRKLRNFLSSNNNQQKLESLLGPNASKEIGNQLLAEDQFQGVANKIANSRTATRLEGMNDTQAKTIGYSPTLVGVASAVPRMGVNALLEHGMANTRQDISRILTTPENKINPVAEALMKYNEKKTSNASSPIGTQAGAMIRALMAGGLAR